MGEPFAGDLAGAAVARSLPNDLAVRNCTYPVDRIELRAENQLETLGG